MERNAINSFRLSNIRRLSNADLRESLLGDGTGSAEGGSPHGSRTFFGEDQDARSEEGSVMGSSYYGTSGPR